MNKIEQTLFLLFLITVFNACKKDHSSQTPSEVVAGYAHLYDTNGIKSADNSGITVSIEGYSVSTTTISNGRWSISHLKTGTYTLVFSKSGFGTMKIYGKLLAGGYQSVDTVSLYPIPQYTIALTSAYMGSDIGISINGIFTGTLPPEPCIHLFFGKASNVSADQANYTYDMALSIPGAMESVEFGLSFLSEILTEKGFKSGDTVYVTAYTDYLAFITYNSQGTISYIDLNTNKKVYPNLNPTRSNILTFVLP